MKLVTKEIEKRLVKSPLYSTDGQGKNANVLVKFFNPTGDGTWLVTEAEKVDDDWLFYGMAKIYHWEFGYFRLSELENVKLPFELKIERDLYIADNATLKDLID